MKDLIDLTKNYPNSYIFRDLNYFLCGIFLLFANNYFFNDLFSGLYKNIIFLSTTEKIFILISLSYFFSRILVEIGTQEARFFRFIIRSILKKEVTIGWNKIIKVLKGEKESDGNHYISHLELEEFVLKNTGLFPSIERDRQNLILKRIFLGYMSVLIIYCYYYFIPFYILLFLSETEDWNCIHDKNLDLLKMLLKNQSDKK